MQKLYCYVDETGQDTQGAFFLVALVILGKEREELRKLLRRVERDSGKTTHKWTRATLKQKRAYLSRLLALEALRGKLLYRVFSHTTDYLTCLIEALAQGLSRRQPPYKVTILIDGLGKSERHRVGAGLRRRGIRTEKIRGLRDEQDEFIRLADAIAGFVRDAQEGKAYAQPLFRRARQTGWLERL